MCSERKIESQARRYSGLWNRKLGLTFLVDYTSYILIIGGIAAASWLLEKIARPAPFVGEHVSGLVKFTSVFGFFIGVLLLLTAASAWSIQAWDSGTRFLLIVTGLALVLKPLKDIPWTALVSIVIGGLCVVVLFLFYPLPETVFGISSTWVYLVVFLIPALFVYVFFKFLEDVLRLIGTILAFKPVAIAFGLVCVVQGILMLLNKSLFTIIFP